MHRVIRRKLSTIKLNRQRNSLGTITMPKEMHKPTGMMRPKMPVRLMTGMAKGRKH